MIYILLVYELNHCAKKLSCQMNLSCHMNLLCQTSLLCQMILSGQVISSGQVILLTCENLLESFSLDHMRKLFPIVAQKFNEGK